FGTPRASDAGAYTITIPISDGAEMIEQSFTLAVSANAISIASIPNQQTEEGGDFDKLVLKDYLSPLGTDSIKWMIEGGEELLFSLSASNEVSVEIPNEDWVGEEQLVISLLDSLSGTLIDSRAVSYEVLNVNDAPVITSEPALLAKVNEPYLYEIVASDIDGDALTTSVVGDLPDFLNFSSKDRGGILFGTPQASDAGTYSIELSVSDGTLSMNQQ
ncbi:MAG: hypothetical protein JXR10_18385, partial [Cyclobacteriaceae bacterium]